MSVFSNRVYSDYLMPSRLPQYEALLAQAAAAGYLQTSVRAFFAAARGGAVQPSPVLVHRHDIDTDVGTARAMFELEQQYGVHASYYFRQTTLDIGFMREIEAYGSEASYHYEEIATFAKRRGIRDRTLVPAHMDAIRAEFLANFAVLERRLGHKMTTVASHGDFANRRLGRANHELLADAGLREQCGIVCETYDAALLELFDLYISDRPHPQYFFPVAPSAAIGVHRNICLLTHPRQWRTNWSENTRDNLYRLYEEIKWRMA
ncbi:hypothetical protein [Janthinobacterium sp.]|uniref:hypothetical protein n=1 Tax=Janthinobacterium sp. TaxID=1871054 RepID=UPI00293D7B09|nr:hypothetical protein [Janthinobacterium sp.]